MNKIVRLNTKLITCLTGVLFVNSTDITNATTIAASTWYYIMRKPESISVQQLLALSNGLHIPVRRFFSTDSTDIIGRREDYVAEPYLECRYDDATLQAIIASRTVTTWQKAAKATGMSRSRLRDSLMAVTRTPVSRFLKVCASFNIDPFKILVDPNPDAKTKTKRRGGETANAGSLAEIVELRKEISRLSGAIDDLTAKYNALLAVCNRMEQTAEREIYAGMAADDGSDGK